MTHKCEILYILLFLDHDIETFFWFIYIFFADWPFLHLIMFLGWFPDMFLRSLSIIFDLCLFCSLTLKFWSCWWRPTSPSTCWRTSRSSTSAESWAARLLSWWQGRRPTKSCRYFYFFEYLWQILFWISSTYYDNSVRAWTLL